MNRPKQQKNGLPENVRINNGAYCVRYTEMLDGKRVWRQKKLVRVVDGIKPMTEIEISRAISNARMEGRLEGLSMAMTKCSGRQSKWNAHEIHMALTILQLHELQKSERFKLG